MANLREQELSLLTCIMAIMQKEELSDFRNRQAAENDRRQNEDQIWQRRCEPLGGASDQPPAYGESPGKLMRPGCCSRLRVLKDKHSRLCQTGLAFYLRLKSRSPKRSAVGRNYPIPKPVDLARGLSSPLLCARADRPAHRLGWLLAQPLAPLDIASPGSAYA
jgi:hypothetical protein